jgi:hypothetical protein
MPDSSPSLSISQSGSFHVTSQFWALHMPPALLHINWIQLDFMVYLRVYFTRGGRPVLQSSPIHPTIKAIFRSKHSAKFRPNFLIVHICLVLNHPWNPELREPMADVAEVRIATTNDFLRRKRIFIDCTWKWELQPNKNRKDIFVFCESKSLGNSNGNKKIWWQWM